MGLRIAYYSNFFVYLEYDIIDRGIGLPKKVITEIEEEGSEGEAESEVRLRRHSKIIHKNTTRRYINTVWKFSDFSAIKILRETNFSQFQSLANT